MSFLPSAVYSAEVWQLECRAAETGDKDCILAQSLSQEGEWLATLRLAPQKDQARFQIQLPAGVHIGSGVFYRVDEGAEKALDFINCDQSRCYAARHLTEAEFQQVKRGNKMQLRLRPEPSLPPVVMEASLSGVTALSQEALQ